MATSVTNAALDALDTLLDAYADIDELLDRWIDADTEGATPEEKRIQKQSNAKRDKVLKTAQRLRAVGHSK